MPSAKPKKWSQHVTDTSDAMDLEPNVFTQADPKKIAEAIEGDAEKSTRRKTTPYRSAMSMLTFYINRAGKNLSAKQRKVLEDAKDVLRAEFGPASKKNGASKDTVTKKTASKKPAARKKAPSRKKTAPKRS